jgi:hypothetical protein
VTKWHDSSAWTGGDPPNQPEPRWSRYIFVLVPLAVIVMLLLPHGCRPF